MAERILLMLGALVLNAFFGGPRRFYAALGVTRIGRLPAQWVRLFERKLNRENRSIQEREMRGWIFALFAILAALIAGSLLTLALSRALPIIELALLACLLPFRSTWDTVAALRRGLRDGNISAARQSLEYTVWKHHPLLDEFGLGRAGMEMLAVHFSEKIVAPILFYVLFGLPGLFLSKTVYLLQETLVRPTESEEAFGRASRKLHHMLHYIPSRMTAGLWLVVAIILPSANVYEAAEQVKNGIFGESPQDLSILAAASVLNVCLGGQSSAYVHEGWIGAGTAKVTHIHIARGLRAFFVLHILLFCFFGIFL
jgi:adenosylcobinamide-phosphate synthase